MFEEENGAHVYSSQEYPPMLLPKPKRRHIMSRSHLLEPYSYFPIPGDAQLEYEQLWKHSPLLHHRTIGRNPTTKHASNNGGAKPTPQSH